MQVIARLFVLRAGPKKFFQISFFIEILLKMTDKQFEVINEITVSLEPWILFHVYLTWEVLAYTPAGFFSSDKVIFEINCTI